MTSIGARGLFGPAPRRLPTCPGGQIDITTIEDDLKEGNETFELELYDRKVKGEYPGDTTWRTSSATYPRAEKLTMTGRIVDR